MPDRKLCRGWHAGKGGRQGRFRVAKPESKLQESGEAFRGRWAEPIGKSGGAMILGILSLVVIDIFWWLRR
jgi:hypothetical protein